MPSRSKSTPIPAFRVETALYRARRAAWIQRGREGEWVVVKGQRVLGFYPTLARAFEAGQAVFGRTRFLVKRVAREDRIETIQRVHWKRTKSDRP